MTDDIDGDARPIGPAPDIGADEYGEPPPAGVTDLYISEASIVGGNLIANLQWTAPGGAMTTTLRHSLQLITEANWTETTVISDSLPGSRQRHVATVPFVGGTTAYFALKTQNSEGTWSDLSNNVLWPYQSSYLPLILRNSGR